MIQGFKKACRAGLVQSQVQSRYSSSAIKSEWTKRRNLIFDSEKKRSRGDVGRIEKIIVKYLRPWKEDPGLEIAMNKHISTPNDVALHASESVQKTAALAIVDGVPWDMHKPLVKDCEISLMTMQMPKECPAVNSVFWRTGSFLLGAVAESSFKDEIQMYLHSFPRPNVKSGSFVYDLVLDLPDWRPSDAELRALSAQFVRLTNQELPIERLEVSEEVALDMFQDNPFKSKQIPEIAKSAEDNSVTLYRVGEHIDISRGPMVGHTGIFGRVSVTAVHKIDSDETDRMYRFQSVALPRGTPLNHFAYGLIEERARKLNNAAWQPQKHLFEEQSTAVAHN